MRLFYSAFTMLVMMLFFSGTVTAQKVIEGKIADAATGEPLASAHIIIKGTYKGTISNEDGEYRLMVLEFPATLEVRFLGFERAEQTIQAGHSGPVDFLLKESVSEMGEITITGEDPAISIMKEVIRRKQLWRARLDTYAAEAYTRQQLKNDTSIVSISESVSEVFWDREKGHREVLKSRRQTANIEAADNFAGVSYMPNFYDDNLEIAGFDMVGVTHPNALSYYTFRLEDIQSLDNEVVYEISVTSDRKLQPLFEGTIFVLGEEYALLSVDLKPNAVVAFPPPVQDFDLTYSQQFSSFGGDYWLPVDVRIEGLIDVGIIGLRFPAIGFRQVSKMNDYKVNGPLPDSLYKNTGLFSVDSTTINSGDSLFIATVDVVPLSEKEELAYENLDSTATLEKAFRPTGFLTRFLDMNSDSDESGGEVTVSSSGGGSSNGSGRSSSSSGRKDPGVFDKLRRRSSPLLRYNRVDALFGGLKYEQSISKQLRASSFAGYSLGYEAPSYGAQLSWWPKKNKRFALLAGYRAETESRYESGLYSPELSSGQALLGYDDYFDYFRRAGIYVQGAYRIKGYQGGTMRLIYKLEEHRSIDFKTSYDITGRENIQRFNSYADEGRLSSVELVYSRGDDNYKAFGAVGANHLELKAEQSAELIGSDWNFTRLSIDVYRRFNTFYKRRFLPNTLDMRLNAGTYLGDLPVQENGVLDAAMGVFTPFGAFKTKRYIPYEGASYIALNAEHNFKSVPLEMLGWRDATKTGLSILAFGGVGKTWIKNSQQERFNELYGRNPVYAEDWHVEAGVSLSNIFNLFRADFAYRLDQPGFFVGVSVARLF